MEVNHAVGGLSALAHAGRLAAYRLMAQASPGGIAAGEIARRLDMLPNTLSAHLSILEQAGLVHSRREGRSILYAADKPALQALLAFVLEDCCGGEPSTCMPGGNR